MVMDVTGSACEAKATQNRHFTLNTKIAFLASWPLAVAIGYGVLAVAIFKFNHPVSGADELSCWQNGECFVLVG